MHLDTLGILIVAKKWLHMLPAVRMILSAEVFQLKEQAIPDETTNVSKISADNTLQRFGVPFTEGRSLDMRWLNLATMVDNLAINIDE